MGKKKIREINLQVHTVEMTEIYSHAALKKFRESSVFTKELISQKKIVKSNVKLFSFSKIPGNETFSLKRDFTKYFT